MTFAPFHQAIERYVMLKRRVEKEVPPRRVTRNVAEINSRTNALFLALQRARPKPRQGDFFDPACSQAIRERFKNALTGVDIVHFQAAIRDDPTDNRLPRVHMRYPVTGSMATMPANLLGILPEVPADLEYRLVGRYLILRDVDAAMILDYVAEAVPLPSRLAVSARHPGR